MLRRGLPRKLPPGRGWPQALYCLSCGGEKDGDGLEKSDERHWVTELIQVGSGEGEAAQSKKCAVRGMGS